MENTNYNALIKATGKQIWDAILDGTIYSIPSLLASFTLVTFADLKKYHFSTFAGYPALHSDPQWKHTNPESPISRLTIDESSLLAEEVSCYQRGDERQRGFFLAKKLHGARPHTEGPADEGLEIEEYTHPFLWKIGQLSEFEDGFFKAVDPKDQYICFADPSTYEEIPGWMLRNLLVLIKARYKLNKAQILCYREVHDKRHEARSIILNVETEAHASVASSATNRPMPKVTGWERNFEGKLKPKTTDMSQYMDPLQLANQSVDLNLKLMKWRIAPGLDLEVIKNTKCLLLGAGTLGSYVSRNLMGWGVRKITFVDDGTVSFSNPVRQPLFNYDDCLEGGAQKAIRAAEALKQIYPGVNSEGHSMTVPMLGHGLLDESRTKADYEKLRKLVAEHDAIFLLMDTRESRWLPTVMGKAGGKIVLNAALGFDSWVAMRHGITTEGGGPAELGCYFCNDVVAPLDSVKDLTLDQQCTVTRPGIAPIASAQLVELLTSILQHPDRGLAPAPKPVYSHGFKEPEYERDPPDHPLGTVPHQIRGFLASWKNMLISGQSYNCCSACSDTVVNAYKKGGWEFVKQALLEKDYISELSGLADVQRRAEAAANDIEWDSDEGQTEADMDGGDGELV